MDARELYLRGKAAEVELMRRLLKAGFAVVRSPGSGRRVRRLPYPDVVAARLEGGRTRLIVFEVKRRAYLRSVYVSRAEYARLRVWVERAGAEAYIAVRIDSERVWKVVPLEWLEDMGNGRYRVTAERIREAPTLADVIVSGYTGQHSRLNLHSQ